MLINKEKALGKEDCFIIINWKTFCKLNVNLNIYSNVESRLGSQD